MKVASALTNRILIVCLVAFSFALASCQKSQDVSQVPPSQTADTKFEASPNPIVVTDGTGSGMTTLSWSTTKSKSLEIHLNDPAGPLMASIGDSGTTDTGKWVTDGMKFYLQDASVPNKTDASATLAVLMVKVVQK